MPKNAKEFNGYHFDDPQTRKLMKYIVITDGDLDLNGAYAFKSRHDLNKYLYGASYPRELLAVFRVFPVTLRKGYKPKG